MGIKNFHMFMRKRIPNSYQTLSFSELDSKKIAIDTSIFMCKFKSSLGNKWMSGFLTMIHKLIDNNIHFIFIFDGKAPPEKSKERENRCIMRDRNRTRIQNILEDWYQFVKEKQDSNKQEFMMDDFDDYEHLRDYVSKKTKDSNISSDDMYLNMNKLNKNLVPISPEDYQLLREMLDVLNIQYVISPDNQEAESLCVLLTNQGIVDATLTEDTDAMAYGANMMLFNVDFRNERVEKLNLDDILTNLEISYEQLKDWCIMCGTDYNKNIHMIGPTKAFDLIKKHGDLETIETNGKKNVDILNYKVTRNLFDCQRFLDQLEITEVKSNDDIKLAELETKKFLFYHNIQLLY